MVHALILHRTKSYYFQTTLPFLKRSLGSNMRRFIALSGNFFEPSSPMNCKELIVSFSSSTGTTSWFL
jgi:hypothetical protein